MATCCWQSLCVCVSVSGLIVGPPGAGEIRPLPEIDASRPRYAWLVEPSQLQAVQTTDGKVCLCVAFSQIVCMRSHTILQPWGSHCSLHVFEVCL